MVIWWSVGTMSINVEATVGKPVLNQGKQLFTSTRQLCKKGIIVPY